MMRIQKIKTEEPKWKKSLFGSAELEVDGGCGWCEFG